MGWTVADFLLFGVDRGIRTATDVDREEAGTMGFGQYGADEFKLDLNSTIGILAREGEGLNIICASTGEVTEENPPWDSSRERAWGGLC